MSRQPWLDGRPPCGRCLFRQKTWTCSEENPARYRWTRRRKHAASPWIH